MIAQPVTCLYMLEAPIKVVSEANAREHWRTRAKRAKAQRELMRVLLCERSHLPPAPPLVVRLTRIAARKFDDDNLAGAFKHIRDGIADWLGIDDGSPLVSWVYAQERGAAKTHAIRVEIGAV